MRKDSASEYSESIEQIAERAEWRGKENVLKRKEIGIRNIAKKKKRKSEIKGVEGNLYTFRELQ